MEQQAGRVGELQEQLQRLEEAVKDLKPQLGRTEALAEDLKQQVKRLAKDYRKIADEHAGLAAALRRFLPEVRRQRCTVHLQRNVLAKVPHRLRKRVAREVAAVFRAPGLATAKKRLAEITARWHNELPEAMRVLERGFTAATQFYAFPEPHWARLRTTNSLERLHTEIKRRIRSAGAFPDRASALRLITAVALRTTAVWSERRYLDLSLLEPKEVAKAA